MSALQFTITNAGLSAIAQAGTLGPVVISQVAIGSGTWATAPTASATALATEIKRITPQGSGTPAPGVIHITASDTSADAYSVYEVGLYTSTGVLFAIYGGVTKYLEKASASVALVAIDLSLANVPVGSVTIGDANFQYPPATETVAGVAEVATNAEVAAGTDDTRMVTPAKLNSAGFVKKAGDTMTGPLVVNASASTAGLRITQSGAGDTLNPVGDVFVETKFANGTGQPTRIYIAEKNDYIEHLDHTPSGLNYDQIRVIVDAELCGSFNRGGLDLPGVSKTTTGYTKLPNGIILQWGTFTADGGTSVTQLISLPIAFPNAIVYANASVDGANSGGVEVSHLDWSTAGRTTTSRLAIFSNYIGTCRFIAIGY